MGTASNISICMSGLLQCPVLQIKHLVIKQNEKGSVYFVRGASRMIKYAWKAPRPFTPFRCQIEEDWWIQMATRFDSNALIGSISKLETQTMYQAFKSPKASFNSGFTTPVCKCHLAVLQSAYISLFIHIHPTNWLFDWQGPFMSICPSGCLSAFIRIRDGGNSALKWTQSIIVISRGTDCSIPALFLFVCWCSIYLMCEPSYRSDQHTGN